MLLFRPYKTKLKHRFENYRLDFRAIVRDVSVLFLLFIFSSLIFTATSFTLRFVLDAKFISIAPELLLILSFNLFFPLVFFTSLSSALSNLYQSEDIELLLSSPLSPLSLFVQKTLVVATESSWMAIISVTPFLLGFAASYGASPLYYILLPIFLALFVLIPSSIAMSISIVWGLIIPRIPPLALISIIGGIGIFILHKILSILGSYLSGDASNGDALFLSAIDKYSNFGESWSPATWLAKSLSPFLYTPGSNNTLELGIDTISRFVCGVSAGASSLVLFLSIGYMLSLHCYSKALSSMWGRGSKVLSFKLKLPRLLSKKFLCPQAFKQEFSLFKKEALEFFRDSTQIVQTLFLLSIMGIYLYILNYQHSIEPFMKGMSPEGWRGILLLVNITLECFISIAMATRLVFPSLSREGRAIWIIQTSPLNLSKFVYTKYIFWCIPIVILISILSTISQYFIYQMISVSIAKLILTIASVLSLNALALFLGARFSEFDWESRSQLVASLGSLIFMLSGLLLIGLNLGIGTTILNSISQNSPYIVQFYVLIIFLASINIALSGAFLRLASSTLERKLAEEG